MSNPLIPRELIPADVRLPEQTPQAAPRRVTTLLDERTVVAANLPRNGLDVRSNIPSHLPLDVLAARTVVPRDTPQTPLDPSSFHKDYDQVTVMDQRVTIPAAMPVVELSQKAPVSAYQLPDVLEPDVLNTGEVNLSVEPIEQPSRDWDLVARIGSTAAHIILLVVIILLPKIFPYRAPTAGEIDDARKQLSFIYMPPDVRGLPRSPALSSPAIRIDPRSLPKTAPSEVAPMPGPKQPERVVREAPVTPPSLPPPPSLPTPKAPLEASNRAPDFLRGTTSPAPQAQSESPTSNGLVLPRSSSPGRALEQSAEQALQGGGGLSGQFGGPVPGAGGGGGRGGGGGAGDMGGALQMLTPTEGVDFNSYLARVLASVKRNWYAIMPESALLGDRGRVTIQFRIMQNGTVPGSEPQLMSGSGKEPLDRAALSSIRASSPFEPLPPAFSGPFIELRFIFLYNVPLNQQ